MTVHGTIVLFVVQIRTLQCSLFSKNFLGQREKTCANKYHLSNYEFISKIDAGGDDKL